MPPPARLGSVESYSVRKAERAGSGGQDDARHQGLLQDTENPVTNTVNVMGTMSAILATPQLGGAPGGPEVLLDGYRACLREALRTLVELENVPTTDPRVLALTTHLSRRQAAHELQEEQRRQHQAEVHHRQLLDQYFRGVDLHYMASASSMR